MLWIRTQGVKLHCKSERSRTVGPAIEPAPLPLHLRCAQSGVGDCTRSFERVLWNTGTRGTQLGFMEKKLREETNENTQQLTVRMCVHADCMAVHVHAVRCAIREVLAALEIPQTNLYPTPLIHAGPGPTAIKLVEALGNGVTWLPCSGFERELASVYVRDPVVL